MQLKDPVRFIKGIGPNKEKLLNNHGIYTIEDFLFYFVPRKFLDKREVTPLIKLSEEKEYFVRGKVFDKRIIETKRGPLLECIIYDETGSARCCFFNGIDYYTTLLKVGEQYLIYGKVSMDGTMPSFIHPQITPYTENEDLGLEPVYSEGELLEKVFYNSHKKLQSTIKWVIDNVIPNVEEFLPEDVLLRFQIPARGDAFRMMHLPEKTEDFELAIKRFKIEEVFIFLLRAKYLKQTIKSKYKGIKIENAGTLIHDFYHKKLDFELTNAQKRVVKEIRRDMGTGQPMNRLLQGDVGSGKTIVAIMSMLIMCANGYQCAFLAPTEILAIQHYGTISRYLFGMPVMVELLVGSTPPRKKEQIKGSLASGRINIIVGTHALLDEDVKFHKLGLVVIDEQHKFGVLQRKKLIEKGTGEYIPHLLVMSATPIPRTIAMTMYGDMDVSIIDEMPPNRKPPITKHFYYHQRQEVIKLVLEFLRKGEQAYWVFPIIEHSEKLHYESIETGYPRLKSMFPPDIKIELLHGKMKYEEKKYIIDRFRNKEIDILVATPVIEVGIDVPDASIIVIESAEKFGLSQLHQLRGRVGRGGQQGYCFLITSQNLTEDAKARISAMLNHTSGFKIAELDLKIRGPGDITGTAQSGIVRYFKFTDLINDFSLITEVNIAVENFIGKFPDIENSPYRELSAIISRRLSEDSLIVLA